MLRADMFVPVLTYWPIKPWFKWRKTTQQNRIFIAYGTNTHTHTHTFTRNWSKFFIGAQFTSDRVNGHLLTFFFRSLHSKSTQSVLYYTHTTLFVVVVVVFEFYGQLRISSLFFSIYWNADVTIGISRIPFVNSKRNEKKNAMRILCFRQYYFFIHRDVAATYV